MKFVCRAVSLTLFGMALMCGTLCTPLRADCPPGTVPINDWGCVTQPDGSLYCGMMTWCAEVPIWTIPGLAEHTRPPLRFPPPQPAPKPAPKK